jgi:hypothetical protein
MTYEVGNSWYMYATVYRPAIALITVGDKEVNALGPTLWLACWLISDRTLNLSQKQLPGSTTIVTFGDPTKSCHYDENLMPFICD